MNTSIFLWSTIATYSRPLWSRFANICAYLLFVSFLPYELVRIKLFIHAVWKKWDKHFVYICVSFVGSGKNVQLSK